jgi:POT family proton-dependent oligopeptide transporter
MYHAKTNHVYSSLRRWKLAFPPITRMAVGFGFEALGTAYAAGIQGWIYSSGPCYDHPLACPESNNGMIPNDLHVAIQIPVYILQDLSESFAFPACYEYAYTKAPRSMKSIVQSILSLSFAGAAIVGLALSPTYHDPLFSSCTQVSLVLCFLLRSFSL